MLQEIHELYYELAIKYEAMIATDKLIIIHFTKARTKYHFFCPLILPNSLTYSGSSTNTYSLIPDNKHC